MKKLEVILANDTPGHGVAGQRVTLAVTPSDMHEPEELETYLAGYKPAKYRADELSPPILVDNETDKFRTFSEDDIFEDVARKGSHSGPIPEVDPKSALDNFKCMPRVIGSFVSRALPGRYDPRYAATRRCKNAISLNREIEVFGLVCNPSSWDPSVVKALGAGFHWNGGASSDPVRELLDAVDRSAQDVHSIWMNRRVGNAFILNPATRDYMRQMLGDNAPSQLAASVAQSDSIATDFRIPGLPPIQIAAAKHKDGSGDRRYCMPDVAALITRPSGVPKDGEEVATTYTFQFKGPSGTGYEVRSWIVENRGAYGGEMIAVTESDDVKMTSAIAGGLITGVLQ